MRGHRLPAPIAINVNIGEANSRQNLSLLAHRHRQAADVAKIFVHVRLHIRQLIMHALALASLGQDRIAILQRSVRPRIFKLFG